MATEAISPEQQRDNAIAQLGTYQERAGQRRIYFDDLVGWLQLELEYDEDGQVIAATRSGQSITPRAAIRSKNQLTHARLYYDLDERVFRGSGLDSIHREDLAKAIIAHAERMLAEGDADDTQNVEDTEQDTGRTA